MNEKTCPRCEDTLPLESFSVNRSRKSGIQPYCIECMKAYRREHYYGNKEPYIARAKKQRNEVRSLVRKIKESNPCVDCGNFYPFYVMDFDHLGIEEKLAGVNMLTSFGVKKVLAEIDKCELVCSNCHRGRTWHRLQK